MISDETREAARLLYESAKESPIRDALLKALTGEDWMFLANAKVHPSDYTDSETYWSDNLICGFLRKNEDLPTGLDLEKLSVETFEQSEFQCFNTNRRLYALRNNFSQEKVDVAAFELLARARQIVRQIIGDRPLSDDRTSALISGEIALYHGLAAHGPGATLSDPSNLATLPDKMWSVPTLTPSAIPVLEDWQSTKWCDAHLGRCDLVKERSLRLVSYDTFFTVPKDATKRRACAKQPNVNVYYQLGLGRELRRLFRPYVDLDVAKGKHGLLALTGSRYGHLATIDLERASDTVALELVKLLMPHQWYRHLAMLRTEATRLPDGRIWKLEKFSSMGNGYTFELESIIFYALSLAAAGCDDLNGSFPFKEDFSVLGDDIVVPTMYSRNVISLLRYCGFTTNSNKTFVDGPFRESCGLDAFSGVPVRGYHQEYSIEQPAHVISALNGLRRSALAGGDTVCRWRVVKGAWHYLRGKLPSELRDLYGPESLGDIVIHGPPEKWKSRVRNSIRTFKCYKPDRFVRYDLEQHWPEDVVVAAKLYGVESDWCETGDYTWPDDSDFPGLKVRTKSARTWITPRGDPLSYHTAWVPCS